MKYLVVLSLSFLALATPSFAAGKLTPQCEAMATAMVKAAIVQARGASAAKAAQYSVTDYDNQPKLDVITVQGYALDGEDSDTYLEYKVELRKLESSGKCYDVQSMTLVGEN